MSEEDADDVEEIKEDPGKDVSKNVSDIADVTEWVIVTSNKDITHDVITMMRIFWKLICLLFLVIRIIWRRTSITFL